MNDARIVTIQVVPQYYMFHRIVTVQMCTPRALPAGRLKCVLSGHQAIHRYARRPYSAQMRYS